MVLSGCRRAKNKSKCSYPRNGRRQGCVIKLDLIETRANIFVGEVLWAKSFFYVFAGGLKKQMQDGTRYRATLQKVRKLKLVALYCDMLYLDHTYTPRNSDHGLKTRSTRDNNIFSSVLSYISDRLTFSP